MTLVLSEKNQRYAKIALIGLSGALLLYSGVKFVVISTATPPKTLSAAEIKKANEPQGKMGEYAKLSEALMREDPTVSLARFGLALSRLCTENSVVVQRVNFASGSNGVGSDPSKNKGLVLVTRDSDITLKGPVSKVYRTLSELTATKIPFRLVNISVARAENNSEPGIVTVGLRAAVFSKGD